VNKFWLVTVEERW